MSTVDELFDALLDDANLPTRTVPLCLDGKLRARHAAVIARIAERRQAAADAIAAAEKAAEIDNRLTTQIPAAGDERDPEQDLADQLAAQIKANTIPFVVQALPVRQYNDLTAAHPPRVDPTTGQTDRRDYRGTNSATFWPALVHACLVSPTMTAERWAKLEPKLTDAQFERLSDAAAEVNRRDEDLPFSPTELEPPPT